jgi:multidrug efflux pump subunit AcrA (membrane-fusion protein)
MMLPADLPLNSALPARRAELIIRPLGVQGPYVVKEPGTGAYYHLGEEEYFLLTQFDGRHDGEAICTAFAERFGQVLTEEDLEDFLTMAKERRLLHGEQQDEPLTGRQGLDPADPMSLGAQAPFGLRILYWRKNFFDPDRFFNRLAPKIWWCWTPAFVMFSAGCIGLAAVLLWANRQGLAHSFLNSLRWETAVLAWVVLLFVTMCHEFAHGLTCKHYGGEVHEVGFLLIFFIPCFYCNVSDAWLFKEKSKRLWVTLAGGYFELFLWALTVFVWRVTVADSLVNYLAFVVMTACGVQTLFNFNPLLKLDGYYLLSDWLEIPNLQQRAGDYVKGHLRRLLWGAPRPERDERGRTLLIYGAVSWLYSLTFLGLSLAFMTHFFGTKLGTVGLVIVGFLGLMSVRGLFHGFTAGEVRNMILYRHKRAVIWAALLIGVPAALFFIPIEDRAGGPFALRPAVRAELRAPVAGFLREICCDEGDRVTPGMLVVRLEVPDLQSKISQKQSDVREAQAKLRLLEVGPRYEEVEQQRRRVERMVDSREQAQIHLARARQAFREELKRLDAEVAQHEALVSAARDIEKRSEKIRFNGTITQDEYVTAKSNREVAERKVAQTQAQKRAREALGTLESETELSKREKELADARATLSLLEAGTRVEEIDAERARLARLREEAHYLEGTQARLQIHSPAQGTIVSTRLKEKVGTFVREGDLIAVVERSSVLEAEIALAEQDVARVRPAQRVELKARAFPYDTLIAQVDRIAPATARGDVQSTLTVYCLVEDPGVELRAGMTGHARVYTGRRSLGGFLVDRAQRFIRTEFWW